jgi:hypothetical protein
MTKLEAVNIILRGMGRAGTAALDTGGNSEAAQAERTLDEVEQRVQTMYPWYFNERFDVTLSPDVDDHITLPTGALVIDAYGPDGYREVTQVGSRIYDKDNNTDEWDADLRVVYQLRYDFGCIPPPIQEYIAAKAAREYNDRYGEQRNTRRKAELERKEMEARAAANRFDDQSADVNLTWSWEADGIRGRRYRPGY